MTSMEVVRVKVIDVEGQAGVIIPDEILKKLGYELGDEIECELRKLN